MNMLKSWQDGYNANRADTFWKDIWKKGSVFISAEDGAVYMVKGLFSTWAEMLGAAPVLLDAVLIPFWGSIISDGLVVPYQIYFGRGAKEDFKDAYMNAKKNYAIRFSI